MMIVFDSSRPALLEVITNNICVTLNFNFSLFKTNFLEEKQKSHQLHAIVK